MVHHRTQVHQCGWPRGHEHAPQPKLGVFSFLRLSIIILISVRSLNECLNSISSLNSLVSLSRVLGRSTALQQTTPRPRPATRLRREEVMEAPQAPTVSGRAEVRGGR